MVKARRKGKKASLGKCGVMERLGCEFESRHFHVGLLLPFFLLQLETSEGYLNSISKLKMTITNLSPRASLTFRIKSDLEMGQPNSSSNNINDTT
jgi:hypothetical protein